MPIQNIELALQDAMYDMARTYNLDHSTSLFVFENVIGMAYGSSYPAMIWNDGSISIITHEGQRDFQMSKEKLKSVQGLLPEYLSHFINRHNVSVFNRIKLEHNGIFYLHVDSVKHRRLEGRLYRYLENKENNAVVNGVYASMYLNNKSVFTTDMKRGLFEEGKRILVCVKSMEMRENGSLRVSCVRKDKRLTQYVVNEAFKKLAVLGVQYRYESWFNSVRNTVTIKEMGKPIERNHRYFLTYHIKKRFECAIRIISTDPENKLIHKRENG